MEVYLFIYLFKTIYNYIVKPAKNSFINFIWDVKKSIFS